MEEDGGTLASIEQGGIFILPAQFYISSVAGNEIMTGYALFLLIEIDAVCYRMSGRSAKRMSRKSAVKISASIKESPNTAIRTCLSSESSEETRSSAL